MRLVVLCDHLPMAGHCSAQDPAYPVPPTPSDGDAVFYTTCPWLFPTALRRTPPTPCLPLLLMFMTTSAV